MPPDAIIRPALFDRLGVQFVAAMSTRLGDASRGPLSMNLSYRVGDVETAVRRDRGTFFDALETDESSTCFAGQCHSATVKVAREPGTLPECDALITNVRGLGVAVSIADCVPILIASHKGSFAAAVHAGWRGSSMKIFSRAASIIIREFGEDPGDLLVWIGPSASSCCYGVGKEVAALFRDDCIRKKGSAYYLDLKKANAREAIDLGVRVENLEIDDRCTICRADLFHSYRRDRELSGRMLAYIRLAV